MLAGAGPKIDDVIRTANGLLVVLNHEDRIAHVSQPLESSQQPLVITRMQTDARFVQHVKDVAQLGADLCGKPDPLAFSV